MEISGRSLLRFSAALAVIVFAALLFLAQRRLSLAAVSHAPLAYQECLRAPAPASPASSVYFVGCGGGF